MTDLPGPYERGDGGGAPELEPDAGAMPEREPPGFLAMIALVAVVVATIILVFFGIGYLLGRLFL